MAASSCVYQAIWLINIYQHLGQTQNNCTKIYCGNKSSIKFSKNPIMHERCKHIDVKYHFLRDFIKDGIVELVHCNSESQIEYIFTKPLKLESFCRLRAKLEVCGFDKLDC